MCQRGDDLLDNITRGRLAEFLVAAALGLHHDLRGIWESYDLVTPDGLRIEVKTAAYVQTWAQERPSDIRFGIAPREGWDPVTGQFDLSVKRRADVYVFCLLKHRDPAKVDPLNLDQWEFYVVPTRVLDEKLGGQKALGLAGLSGLGATAVTFDELRPALDNVAPKGEA